MIEPKAEPRNFRAKEKEPDWGWSGSSGIIKRATDQLVMLLCKWNTVTFWDVRLVPSGSNQGAALREDGCLFLPVKFQEPLFSQVASWVPISFETAGVSDPKQQDWECGSWAHGTLESRENVFLAWVRQIVHDHWGSLSKVYGSWVGSFCLLQNIWVETRVHCSWERVLCFHYTLRGITTLSNHSLKHGGKEYGLVSYKGVQISALPFPMKLIFSPEPWFPQL